MYFIFDENSFISVPLYRKKKYSNENGGGDGVGKIGSRVPTLNPPLVALLRQGR